jgi:hypothetical protein
VTELFGVVIMHEERPGDVVFIFPTDWFRKEMFPMFCGVCNGMKGLPVDTSSVFKPPCSVTMLVNFSGPVGLGWIVVISDTVCPLERLS